MQEPTVSQPRRPQSTSTLPWEPQVSHWITDIHINGIMVNTTDTFNPLAGFTDTVHMWYSLTISSALSEVCFFVMLRVHCKNINSFQHYWTGQIIKNT
jgi:hypothetical protein